jgi:surface polysaccharide O-acyltransferase-like enzyme
VRRENGQTSTVEMMSLAAWLKQHLLGATRMAVIESATEKLNNAPQPPRVEQCPPKKEFLNYIHNFRGVAILYIVAGHCVSLLAWPDAQHTERALRCVLTGGSVFFVFIAGYLFQHLSANFKYSSYLASKLNNVVCPYIILSLPAIVLWTAITQRQDMWPGFYEHPYIVQAAIFLLTGRHITPYWFIPMICLFYVIAPLLVYLDRRRWVYFFLPAFIAVSLTSGRGWHPLHNMGHFFSAYLLGMFFSRYRKETLGFASWGWPVLLGLAGVCIGPSYHGVYNPINWNFLQKLLLCAVWLWLLKAIDSVVGKWLAPIATASFGIFFLHPYVMALMRKTFVVLGYGDTLPSGNIAVLGLLFAVTVATCMFLVYAARWILGARSRLVIGS